MTSPRKNSFDTGIAAEYYVLSQLYRQGIEAYISQGNKKNIDIRLIRSDGIAVSVDVKAVRGYSSVVVNNVRPSDRHYIVIVIYNDKFEDISTVPDVFVVPSGELAAITSHWKDERRVMKGKLKPFQNRWDTLLTHTVCLTA